MTSALEKDGTEDLIDCFYKVAKPGEWIDIDNLCKSTCSKEQVESVFRDKFSKVYNKVFY